MKKDLPFVGQLDRRVSINSYTGVQNTTGEAKPAVVKVTDAWAQMIDKSGDEQTDGKIKHVVRREYIIRYFSSILSNGHEYFLHDGNQIFAIHHVIELQRKMYLKLICSLHE